MIDNVVAPLCALFAAGGIASHWFHFSKGEHHMYGVYYLQAFLGVYCLLFLESVLSGNSYTHSLQTSSEVVSAYLIGLFGSLLLYRIFLSPLKKFPGPWLAKVSAFNFSFQAQNGKGHFAFHRLHHKYGEFVRIGPSNISTIHPKAITAIYGRGSPCIKGEWYSLMDPLTSMHTTRDRKFHDERRRIWSNAFNPMVIRNYEKRINRYQDQLIDYLSARDGQTLEVREVVNLYAFDVMGDLAFGASFRMLEKGDTHWAIRIMQEGTKPVGLQLPDWLVRLLLITPGAMKDFYRFVRDCQERLETRMKSKVEVPDITSHLLEPYKTRQLTIHDKNQLIGDATLIVIAGSDTTVMTLVCVLHELALLPDGFSRLRKEIESVLDLGKPLTNDNLQSLQFLNGAINEALRLYPPATYLQRKTPPEGLVIGSTHIPGETTISSPAWALARSEALFVDANTFRPERWYSEPHLVKEASAFAPFSIGPYNCIGKPLALMNLRTTLAKLVWNFDIAIADGEDGTRFRNNMRTNFATTPGELDMTFRKRAPLTKREL